jgi:formate C-acetyltransferase
LRKYAKEYPNWEQENFWEAVQAVWFWQLALQIEGNGNSVSLGRLDQHLYSYFKNDLEKREITIEKAQEILDLFWLKLNEIIKVWDTEASRFHAGP